MKTRPWAMFLVALVVVAAMQTPAFAVPPTEALRVEQNNSFQGANQHLRRLLRFANDAVDRRARRRPESPAMASSRGAI